MPLLESKANAVVIGGGFYGVNIALYLARQKKVGQVVLLEREKGLLTRASYSNQARVHNGYHYPRSFTTAYRSRINLPRFVEDWPEAVKTDFTKIYAIARNNSKVTAKQFQRFCQQIDAKIEVAKHFNHLLNTRLIEQTFLVEEYAFDSTKLAEWSKEQLSLAGVEVVYNATVLDVKREQAQNLSISYQTNSQTNHIKTDTAYNCTYSGLNQFGGDFTETHTKLKHEITEMALMQMPRELENLGITVMDGPFFSMMPFPARNLHTLSHVRYTPHMNWLDENGINPYSKLAEYEQQTRVDRMVRDVQRYIPAIESAVYKDSIFEVKTVLVKSETDDGRPILFEEYPNLPGFYSVLGGKIDNIYDVLEKISEKNN